MTYLGIFGLGLKNAISITEITASNLSNREIL